MTEASASSRIGWPFPWMGLLLGGLLLLGMTTEIGSLVGLLFVLLLFAGYLSLAAVFGLETADVVAGPLLGLAVIAAVAGLLIAIGRARTSAGRLNAMNLLVGFVLTVLAMLTSLESLERHWPV